MLREAARQPVAVRQFVVGGGRKRSERKFGNDSFQARFDGQRMQQHARSHGLPESHKALHAQPRAEPVAPRAHVCGFAQPERHLAPAAFAVAAAVRRQHRKALAQQHGRVLQHRRARIHKSMQHQSRAPAPLLRVVQQPRTQRRAVHRAHFHALHLGVRSLACRVVVRNEAPLGAHADVTLGQPHRARSRQ